MSIHSMTGFGSASGEFAGRTLTVELKSVNNRFREVVVRAPKICAPLEEAVKKRVALRLERGRVDLWVQLDEKDLRRQNLKADLPMALEVKRLLEEIKDGAGLADPVTLAHLLPYNVLRVEDESPDLESLWEALQTVLDEALERLVAMRQAEGRTLAEDLKRRLTRLADWAGQVEKAAAAMPGVLLERLKTRLAELAAGVSVDPGRLAQEAALLADRADITEEVVRLKSHLDRFHEILDSGDPAGRKLDFLLQEMGREVNTMGSKSQDLNITGLVLDMKSELEKLREQVQNVE